MQKLAKRIISMLLLIFISNGIPFHSSQVFAQGKVCLNEQGSSVKVFLFSANDKLFFTNLNENEVGVWDVATGMLLRTFSSGFKNLISSADISPDSKFLAVASPGGKVILWDTNSGTQLQTFVHPTENDVIVQFSPNGKYLLTYSSLDNPSIAILWDPLTGQKVHDFAKDGDPRN